MAKYLIAAFMLAAASCLAFETNTTTDSFIITTDSISDYDSFDWNWSALDDQKIDAHFDEDVTDGQISFRMLKKKVGDVILDISGFSVVGTSNAVIAFSGTNLPPNRTYYAGFAIVNTNQTPARYRNLAKGKVTILNSLWQNTNFIGNGWQDFVTPTYPAGTGDIDSVTVSGGLLTGGATSGDVPIGLTTSAVQTAAAPAYKADDLIVSNALVALCGVVSNASDTLSGVVSNAFRASDLSTSNSYVAADLVVSNAWRNSDTIVSNAFLAVDVITSNALVALNTMVSNAFVTADLVVSNDHVALNTMVSNAFISADNTLSNNAWAAFGDVICEQSFIDGASQSFTGASGFEIITNFSAHITDTGYTRSHSNVTITSAGRYKVSMQLSFENNGAGQFECLLYSNGVVVVDAWTNNVGWERTVGASATDGAIAASKTITFPASCILDWRMDAGGDEVTTWGHGTWQIERK